MKSLTLLLKASVLQNVKRLRTFSRPQEIDIIPIDPALFQEVSLMTLIRFRQAFQKIAENNKNSQISVELSHLNKLEVSSKEGSLVLEADKQISIMFYSSPISGTYKYYYDTVQKRFYSNKDGHLLDQNLSRDAQRYLGDILDI